MLISHEVPISLLENSWIYNDYDYCLLHLTYDYPEYRKYYQDAIRGGRKVLLDNSLFELGDALTVEDVRKGVLDINPTWAVVPDCLNNADKTIERFQEWQSKCSDLDVLTIGVVQGATLDDMVRCYQFMSEHADKIAIPFDSMAFNDLYPMDPLEAWCLGRQSFIEYLVDDGIWNNEKPHHLLGCSYAKEFSNPLYRKVSIESIDTSNPVVAAIKGLRYESNGLGTKPSVKLCDLITEKLSEEQLPLLEHNIKTFRQICNSQKWVTFFSQTGSEILEVSKRLKKAPDIIVTNRSTFEGVNEELVALFGSRIVQLPDRPTEEEYQKVLESCSDDDIITLHGYLRIVPEFKQLTLNSHPGLITKYPELKGFNPQEKAFNLGLSESGVVIHIVTSEVDSGEIIAEVEVPIKDLPLDQVYEVLHDASINLWTQVLESIF